MKCFLSFSLNKYVVLLLKLNLFVEYLTFPSSTVVNAVFVFTLNNTNCYCLLCFEYCCKGEVAVKFFPTPQINSQKTP